jgi:thymidine kinase
LARGRFLRLFIGNMASGKTRHLLTEIDTLRKYGNKKIAVFKPRTDTRSGMNFIKSRRGDEDAAEEISATRPYEMWPILHAKESAAGCRFEVIAFDEVQFFTRDSGFFQMVRQLMADGYDILASGLAFDFRGEPFGSTPDVALLAEDRCMWMTAYCTRCGGRAPYPQRIIDGVPAHYNSPQILVGGDETYEPRCDDHFVLPGRPLPGMEDLQPSIFPAGQEH